MLKIAWSPVYKYHLPDGHRFPMEKYELIPEQLLYEGTARETNFFHPKPLPKALALLTHTKDYFDKLTTVRLTEKEVRAIGFPINEKFVERAKIISNGTIECTTFAREYGVAINAAGGTHHAFADRGEGYCCFNDQAVAANYLLHKGLSKKILIIDLDVHQGNGTAKIFENEERVFTFSMHGEKNYPLRKEVSNMDIGLADGTSDADYLKVLAQTLPRITDSFQPDFVFYQAGVDILATDRLGRLAVTRAGCAARDHYVFSFCKKNKLPVVASMGGGYAHKIADLVEAHANTFRMAQEIFF